MGWKREECVGGEEGQVKGGLKMFKCSQLGGFLDSKGEGGRRGKIGRSAKGTKWL